MKQSFRRGWIWQGAGALVLGASALSVAFSGATSRSSARAAGSSPVRQMRAVQAPELVGDTWLNAPDNKPITLASRRGQVTILSFWTFGCVPCVRNLPAYAKWHEGFASRGVQFLSVHTPKSKRERDPKNVQAFARKNDIRYPILLDNNGANWNRWKQIYWPTIYVLDKQNRIRYTWTGELEYKNAGGTAQIEAVVERLLNETPPENATATLPRVRKTDAQWQQVLSPAQFNILRRAGTERAFSGEYKSKGAGLYSCAGCGQGLFDASTKFDSGTGWPSFYRALPQAIAEHRDTTLGMTRTEVVCARCDGHLGHVFDDGPQPTGLRYCMNSLALQFDKE